MTPAVMLLAPAPVMLATSGGAVTDDAVLAPFAAVLAAALPAVLPVADVLANAPDAAQPMLVETGTADMSALEDGRTVPQLPAPTLPVPKMPVPVTGAAVMLRARLALPVPLSTAPDGVPSVLHSNGLRRVAMSPALVPRSTVEPAPISGRRLSAGALWDIIDGRAPYIPTVRPETANAPVAPVSPVASMQPLPSARAAASAMADPSEPEPAGILEPGVTAAVPGAVRVLPLRGAAVRARQAITEDVVQIAPAQASVLQLQLQPTQFVPLPPSPLPPTHGAMTTDSAPAAMTPDMASTLPSTKPMGTAFQASAHTPVGPESMPPLPPVVRRASFEAMVAGDLIPASPQPFIPLGAAAENARTLPVFGEASSPEAGGADRGSAAGLDDAGSTAVVVGASASARQPDILGLAAPAQPVTAAAVPAMISQHPQAGDRDPTGRVDLAGLAVAPVALPEGGAFVAATQPMASEAFPYVRQANNQPDMPAMEAGDAPVLAALTTKPAVDAAIALARPALVATPLPGVPFELAVVQPVRDRADRSRPDRYPAPEVAPGATGVARPQAQLSQPIALAADVASVAASSHGAAAPRRDTASAAMTVASERLGVVSVGLEGGPQDLRVQLSGSAAAVGTMTAEAPRLVADLAANGLRLQSLDFGGADDGSGQGAFQSSGQGLSQNSTPFSGQSQGDGRARATSPAASNHAADAFAADRAREAGGRRTSLSDRYA